MRLLGKVWKSKASRFWIGEVPDLDLATQGESKADALEMIRDAIETLVDEKTFKVSTESLAGHLFTVAGSSAGPLMALLLKRQREAQGLTIRQVSARLSSNSPNAYAQYEQGARVPTIDKLDELLRAVNQSAGFVVTTTAYQIGVPSKVKKRA